MKKTLRSILTLFLVVAMLFGISASTVAFALESVSSNSSASGNNAGQNTHNQSVTEGTGSSDSSVSDWIVIEHTDDEIKVTLNPSKEGLKATDKELVTELLSEIKNAVLEVILGDVKSDIFDKYFGDVGIDEISPEDFIQTVIDGYISTLDPSIAESENPYYEFFKALIDEDSSVDIDDFVDHYVVLIEAVGTLTNFYNTFADKLPEKVFDKVGPLENFDELINQFSVEQLRDMFDAETIEITIDELLDHEIHSVLSTHVDEYVETYLEWIKSGESFDALDLPGDVKNFINDEISEHLAQIAVKYLNGTLESNALNNAIKQYIETELEKHVRAWIAAYAASTPHTSGYADVDSLIEETIDELAAESAENYILYRYGRLATKPLFYDSIDEHVTRILPGNYATERIFRLEFELYGKQKAIDEITEKLLDEYDPNDTAEYDSTISSIISEVIASSRFDEELEDKVHEILNAGNAIDVFRSAYAVLDKDDQDAVMDDIVDRVHEATEFDFYAPNEFSDKVFGILLGMTHHEFQTTLDGFEQDIVVGFDEVLDELEEQTEEECLVTLIDYINAVRIGGIEIFGEVYDKYGSSYVLQVEAIRELIHSIPTPQQIAELSPDEMVWSYDFVFDTEFFFCDFTITVEIGENHDLVTKLAEKVSEYLFYYYSDEGVYVVDLTLPEIFSKLVLKACQTGRISDELKSKIFSALNMTDGDIYALYSEKLTFANILELLESIDIDGLLDKEFVVKILENDFVENNIDTSKLTEEEILKIIKKQEDRYNKLFELGKKVLRRIPAEYKDKTIMDFYDMDKEVFHIADGITLDFVELIEEYSDKLPDIISSYPNLIATYIDTSEFAFAFDLTLDFEKINRVEYIADGETVRTGMLPYGADVSVFAGINKIGSKDIVAWVDEEGKVVETMPDRDVVLTAVVDVDFVVSVSDDIDKTYDGAESSIWVNVSGSTTAKFTYQWYKNGELLTGATSNRVAVKNVKDSGTYYCVISAVDGIIKKTLTSGEIKVNIQKKVIDSSVISWDYPGDGEFIYNNVEYTVRALGLPAGVTVSKYENNVKVNADNYTAKILALSVDSSIFDSDNYELDEASIKSATLDWKIAPKPVKVSGLSWNISGPQEYTGNVYVPQVLEIPEGVKLVGYGGDISAKEKGVYETTATFAPINSNYEIDGSNTISTSWSITDNYVYVDVSRLSWVYENATPYVYDGTVKSVAIKGYNTAEVKPVYSENSAIDADDYIASASFVALDGESFVKLINGTEVPTFNWSIDKASVDLSKIEWNYTGPFTYNFGEVFGVDILSIPEQITVEIDENSVYAASEIGVYVATATATLKSQYTNNYKLTNSIPALTWEIVKIKVTVNADDFEWNYDPSKPYIYNGKSQTVSLVGQLPTGVKVSYNGAMEFIVGDYIATATFVPSDSSIYEVSVIGTVPSCSWKIEQMHIDLSKYGWSADLLPYTGSVQSVTVIGLPSAVVLTYEGNTAIEVGEYIAKATAVLTDTHNYYMTGSIKDHKWTITNQIITVDPYITKWDYTSALTYAGVELEVLLKNLPDGVIPVYSGNKATNVGTYTASVTFKAVDPNVLVLGEIEDLTWQIVPRAIDLSDYSWGNGIFDYDGEEHRVTLVGLPLGLEVIYEGNTATAGGKYTATATAVPSDNFIITGEFSSFEWEIRKSVVDLSGVYWNYTDPFVFNNMSQSVVLAGIPDFVPAEIFSYSGNFAINAGVYTASVSLITDIANKCPEFFASCEIVNFAVEDLTWEILKADADLSGISFNDASYEYDGKVHDLVVTGNIPEYLGVKYNKSGLFLMGEYEIVASFYILDAYKANYNVPVETMTATLTIITYTIPEHFYPIRDNFVVSVKADNPLTGDHNFVVNDVSHIDDGHYISNDLYGRVITAYDISFYRGGAYMPQEGSFTVKIYVPEEYRDGHDLRVLYVAEDGDVEQLNGEINGEYMVFNTSHFSTYAVVNIEEPPVDPERPDFTWLWILLIILAIIILAIIIIALIIFLIIRKKFKKKDDDDTTPPTDPDGSPEDDAAKKAAAEKAAAEKAAAEKAAAEKAAAEKAAAEKAAAEKAATEKAAAEKAAAEKAAAEKAAAEKAAAEKAAAEKAAPEVVVVLGQNPDEEDGAQGTIIDGEVVYVRYRSSFESRLIQAETDIQDYYTVIKNALLSYKGVKARTSWNYESFNKGRVSCAKVNIKGRTLVIYLNLNPAEYNINKYHFVDMSENPKFDQTPMLMKVRSDRALKYTVELIEEMMKVLEIPALETPANEDYHMPYETTEALAKRGLVKVILPPGMTLDENSNIVKANVGELIDTANATVSIENTPLAALKPEITEAVHVDAVHADELITDEEAQSVIEVIHTGATQRVGKLAEINLDTICENYADGEIVNLDTLKEKRLVSKDTARVKVLARGTMLKALTVIASKFSLQAVKMIILAGGIAEIED